MSLSLSTSSLDQNNSQDDGVGFKNIIAKLVHTAFPTPKSIPMRLLQVSKKLNLGGKYEQEFQRRLVSLKRSGLIAPSQSKELNSLMVERRGSIKATKREDDLQKGIHFSKANQDSHMDASLNLNQQASHSQSPSCSHQDTGVKRVMQKCRSFSKSPRWSSQRSFYSNSGMKAWRKVKDNIPFHVSSNCLSASQLGESILNYARENRLTSLTVIDFGAGHGLLSYHLARYFRRQQHQLLSDDNSIIDIVVVVSDFNRELIEQHMADTSIFHDLKVKGLIDFAIIDALSCSSSSSGSLVDDSTCDEPILLLHSKKHVSGPLVLVMSYFIDSLPCDIFRTNKEGKLFEIMEMEEEPHLKKSKKGPKFTSSMEVNLDHQYSSDQQRLLVELLSARYNNITRNSNDDDDKNTDKSGIHIIPWFLVSLLKRMKLIAGTSPIMMVVSDVPFHYDDTSFNWKDVDSNSCVSSGGGSGGSGNGEAISGSDSHIRKKQKVDEESLSRHPSQCDKSDVSKYDVNTNDDDDDDGDDDDDDDDGDHWILPEISPCKTSLAVPVDYGIVELIFKLFGCVGNNPCMSEEGSVKGEEEVVKVLKPGSSFLLSSSFVTQYFLQDLSRDEPSECHDDSVCLNTTRPPESPSSDMVNSSYFSKFTRDLYQNFDSVSMEDIRSLLEEGALSSKQLRDCLSYEDVLLLLEKLSCDFTLFYLLMWTLSSKLNEKWNKNKNKSSLDSHSCDSAGCKDTNDDDEGRYDIDSDDGISEHECEVILRCISNNDCLLSMSPFPIEVVRINVLRFLYSVRMDDMVFYLHNHNMVHYSALSSSSSSSSSTLIVDDLKYECAKVLRVDISNSLSTDALRSRRRSLLVQEYLLVVACLSTKRIRSVVEDDPGTGNYQIMNADEDEDGDGGERRERIDYLRSAFNIIPNHKKTSKIFNKLKSSALRY
jgi:hypothetical protein